MPLEIEMKECQTCIFREHKDDLLCCQGNHLALAFREMLKQIPFFGRHVPDYECQAYEMDVDPEANLPHEVCELMCWNCGSRFISVFPEKTPLKQLECGNCHAVGFMVKTGQTVTFNED
jgi:hypothetical protein